MPPTLPLTLTDEQQHAVDRIVSWAQSRPFGQHLTMGGLAGTGKTTLIRYVHDELRNLGMAPVVGTPTGKAAHVLQRKGIFARTLHSMIYECIGSDSHGQPIFEFLGLEDGTPILIADEASMVNARLHADIMRTGVPVLYVGDYGQLPPVGDDPGIMAAPDIVLREIHRQAQGNPIVQLAHHFREGGTARSFDADGGHVTICPRVDYDEAFAHDALLCGRNATRSAFNRYYLSLRAGIDLDCETLTEGQEFDAICLRNNRRARIFNGMCGRMRVLREPSASDRFPAEFRPDGDDRVIELMVDGSLIHGRTSEGYQRDLDLFDLAYVLTVHKAQGSEWDRVTVLDEAFGTDADKARWRYTAATRAKECLCWLM